MSLKLQRELAQGASGVPIMLCRAAAAAVFKRNRLHGGTVPVPRRRPEQGAPVRQRGRPGAGLWMGLAFGATLVVAGLALRVAGLGPPGIRIALQWTARFLFLLFWPAYVGGALAALFGPAFGPMQRRGRELGLAFAAGLSVHLGLVIWLCLIGAAPAPKVFAVFGVAALWVYLLALFSFGGWRQKLGSRGWWLLRMAGMNYVALAFADDFLRNPLSRDIRHVAFYWPFAILAVAGLGIRLAEILVSAARKFTTAARPRQHALAGRGRHVWLPGQERR